MRTIATTGDGRSKRMEDNPIKTVAPSRPVLREFCYSPFVTEWGLEKSKVITCKERVIVCKRRKDTNRKGGTFQIFIEIEDKRKKSCESNTRSWKKKAATAVGRNINRGETSSLQ